MRRLVISLVVAALAAAAYLGGAYAAEVRPRASSDNWQFELAYHSLRAIRVQLPGYEEPMTFWYILYTVTNRTGEDRLFVPDIVLYTDQGELNVAGRGVSRDTYTVIKQLYNDPLLRTPTAMTGKLLEGEDNAKHSVAIWPDFDANCSMVDVFFGGLSGETKELILPKPIKKILRTPDGKEKIVVKTKVILVKTLHLRFKITGDPNTRHLNEPVLVSANWVMREPGR